MRKKLQWKRFLAAALVAVMVLTNTVTTLAENTEPAAEVSEEIIAETETAIQESTATDPAEENSAEIDPAEEDSAEIDSAEEDSAEIDPAEEDPAGEVLDEDIDVMFSEGMVLCGSHTGFTLTEVNVYADRENTYAEIGSNVTLTATVALEYRSDSPEPIPEPISEGGGPNDSSGPEYPYEMPETKWYHEGVLLEEGCPTIGCVKAERDACHESYTLKAELWPQNVQSGDFGKYTVTVKVEDREYSADMYLVEKRDPVVTVKAGDGGSVTPSGTFTVPQEAAIEVDPDSKNVISINGTGCTAAANDGYEFVCWGINGVSRQSFKVTEDTEVEAIFRQLRTVTLKSRGAQGVYFRDDSGNRYSSVTVRDGSGIHVDEKDKKVIWVGAKKLYAVCADGFDFVQWKGLPEPGEFGMHVNEDLTVTAVYKPHIFDQLWNQKAKNGQTVSFGINYGPDLNYQWQESRDGKNWVNIPSATGRTCYVQASTQKDKYQYRCLVSWEGETAVSNAAALTIIPDLKIVTQPKSQKAERGETVTFSVKAAGDGLTYQWERYYRGSCFDIKGANTATYSVTADSNQSYRCRVTDSTGDSVWSSLADLTIRQDIKITQQPADQKARDGNYVKFEVRATGDDLTYQWQTSKDGKNWTDIESGTSYYVYVKAESSNNGNSYRCVVTDSANKKAHSNPAVLKMALQITKQPENQAAKKGRTATFCVEAKGHGLTWQWQESKDGENWTDIPSAADASLAVTADDSNNGNSYRCVITDSDNESVTSEPAVLTKKKALVIIKQPEDQKAKAGNTVIFHVEADGDGLTYQWMSKAPTGTAYKKSGFTSAGKADLKVPVTKARNGASYYCAVTDSDGDMVETVKVTLTVKPELIITSDPESQAAASGTRVTFRVTAEGDGLKYRWQESKDGENWTDIPSAADASLAVTVDDSNNGNSYHCVVTDSDNASVTSEPAVLTKKKALVITEQPEDQKAKAGNTVIFHVEADGDGLTYQWQVSKDGKNWTDTPSAADASLAVTVNDSNSGNSYRCVVTDYYKESVTSEPAVLKMAPEITEQPENQAAKNGNYVSFVIKANGIGLKYQWQYRKSETEAWENCPYDDAKTAEYQVFVTDATDGNMYHCVITDAYGTTETSDTASLRQKVALKITKQPADQDGKSKQAVYFDVEANGDGLKYQWQYRKSKDGAWTDSTVSSATTARLRVAVTKAKNGYQYRCVITDSEQDTKYSNPATLIWHRSLVLTLQPTDQKAKAGKTVTFSTAATGENLTYQWMSKAPNGTAYKKSGFPSAKDANLKVPVKEERDGASYYCVITDALGDTVTTDIVTLTMKPELAITSNPKSQTAASGTKVTFSVTAVGDGLKYQWQRSTDGGKTWADISTNEAKTAKKAALSVTAQASRNGYRYQCKVTDSDGESATSKAAKLTVK